MQYRFFTIPASAIPDAEDELNRFLRGHRVLTVYREFVPDPANPRWCLAVEYLEGTGDKGNRKAGKQRIDYKEILPPEDFALFAKLREWRKGVAEQEGVPVYTIFTNEQLAQVAGRRIGTKAALADIEGIGEARIGKYGDAVLEIVGTVTTAEDAKEGRLEKSG